MWWVFSSVRPIHRHKEHCQHWRSINHAPMTRRSWWSWVDGVVYGILAFIGSLFFLNRCYSLIRLGQFNVLCIWPLLCQWTQIVFLKSLFFLRQSARSAQGIWVQSVVSMRHRSSWAPTTVGAEDLSLVQLDRVRFFLGSGWVKAFRLVLLIKRIEKSSIFVTT